MLGFMAGLRWSRYYHDDRWSEIYFLLTMLCFAIGAASIRLTYCIRYLDQKNQELVNQSAIDRERIWKLEDEIAELKNKLTR